MMDVQWHWTNLWFAAQAKNWPLAQYYFNETRGHIQWFVKKSPTMRSAGPEREEVNIEGIFDGIDTSSLTDVKNAIAKKDPVQFANTYKIMNRVACNWDPDTDHLPGQPRPALLLPHRASNSQQANQTS